MGDEPFVWSDRFDGYICIKCMGSGQVWVAGWSPKIDWSVPHDPATSAPPLMLEKKLVACRPCNGSGGPAFNRRHPSERKLARE